jgi:hypothetical protein
MKNDAAMSCLDKHAKAMGVFGFDLLEGITAVHAAEIARSMSEHLVYTRG